MDDFNALLNISFGPLISVLIQMVLSPSVLIAQQQAMAYSKAFFFQLQNALSFESEAAHLRSRGHGKEKVHVFSSRNFK